MKAVQLLDFQISEITTQDIPDLLDLWEEFKKYNELLHPANQLVDNAREVFETHLQTLIEDDNTLILIARNEEEAYGFAITTVVDFHPIYAQSKRGMITDMAVTGKHRRAGVGNALLAEIETRLANEGVMMIELRVTSKNSSANRFWRKNGFTDYRNVLMKDIQ